MEYDESRPYQAGDDIRSLDWRVTARTGKPHTKLFREERERPVYAAIDASRSMYFATQGVFKVVQAARAAALLSWKAHASGDRIGGFVFGETEHHEVIPKAGEVGVLRLLKTITTAAPPSDENRSQESALAAAMPRVRRVVRPGGLVFILSDFARFDDDIASEIATLGAHADVVLVHVHDPIEFELPAMPTDCRVSDGQSRFRLALASTGLREQYNSERQLLRETLESFARSNRMLMASLSTIDDPLKQLQRALARS